MVRVIVAALFAVALAACDGADAPPVEAQHPENGSLVSLSASRLAGDAAADARFTHADGGSHLYAVMGEGLMFPGAADADAARLGYLVIQGTGDAFSSDEERRFNAAAQRYAAAWNGEMLRLDAAS